MSESLLFELDQAVAVLTINRPDRMNALDPATQTGLMQALDRAVDEGARAVVLTAVGRTFCAGVDIVQLDLDRAAENVAVDLETIVKVWCLKLAELPIPVVCAVNGPAIGAGMSLALSADMAVAGESAFFSAMFTSIGLAPDCGASWLLPRMIGLPRALQMVLLGEKIPARQAEQWGMIYRCTADDQVLVEAKALAARLADRPTLALGRARAMIRAACSMPLSAALDHETANQVALAGSDDFREAANAFLQKRKPSFRGR